MVAHRLFISFYLPEDEFERLSSRSSFFSSVVSSMLVTVSAFSEMFESSCFFMCPVSISVTTMVSKNCFNFGSMDLHQYCSSNCIGKSIKPNLVQIIKVALFCSLVHSIHIYGHILVLMYHLFQS